MSSTNKRDHSINGDSDNGYDGDPGGDDIHSSLEHCCYTHCPTKFPLERQLTRYICSHHKVVNYIISFLICDLREEYRDSSLP